MSAWRDNSVNETLAILAGGRGRRLGGVPKGLLRLPQGETIVERLLRLGPEPRMIIANEPNWYERFNVPVVGDIIPGKGAPGGVVTALAMAQTEWVLVLACDMPWVTQPMIESLRSQCRRPGIDVVCFQRDEALEPLAALYRRELCFEWYDRLWGNPSLRSLLADVRVHALQAEDPRRLLSLNEPADIAFASQANLA